MSLPIWIDPRELDELQLRFPDVSRADLAMALERHWPVKAEVEAAVSLLVEAHKAALRGHPIH